MKATYRDHEKSKTAFNSRSSSICADEFHGALFGVVARKGGNILLPRAGRMILLFITRLRSMSGTAQSRAV